MDPERWRRIGDVFHRAREQDAGGRARFLDDACRGDAALRAEVESLLAHHEGGASPVLPTPPDGPAPGASPAPPTPPGGPTAGGDGGGDPLEGGRLGPYRIVRKLGEGGMGVVHLAEDTRLGRLVAVKALPPRFTRDEGRRRRLRREARAAASLTHPGIATVYALEEFDGVLCLVSEYVPGETLRQELAGGPLAPADLFDTAVAVARALAAAHAGNVLHRDLKPENVIRTRGAGLDAPGVKLVDFGLARFDDPGADTASAPRLTAPGAALGTPGYMAPEQIRGEEIDGRTDVFAFGVLLFELASGRHPFTASGPVPTVARVLEAAPPDLRRLAPGCPPDLPAIIGRCMRKDPAERYGTARALVDALERARRSPNADADEAPAGGDRRSTSTAADEAGAGETRRSANADADEPRVGGTRRSANASAEESHGGGIRPSANADADEPRVGGTRRSSNADADEAPADRAARATAHETALSPVWWWRFHQRTAGLAYYAMLYPLWRVREWAPAPWGTAVFFAALAAVLVAANLRFHLSFTERFTPAQIDLQRAQSAPWIRAADWLFAVLLLAASALVAETRPAWAAVTAAVGIVSGLAFLAIEPATTRAAFRHRPRDRR